jgi:hypothetical protein
MEGNRLQSQSPNELNALACQQKNDELQSNITGY